MPPSKDRLIALRQESLERIRLKKLAAATTITPSHETSPHYWFVGGWNFRRQRGNPIPMIAYGFFESYQHGQGSHIILLLPIFILFLLSYPWRK